MMNEEQFFLANAYLDGEVTDEERRLAEADPAVMTEVATLRALQAQIRAAEPPSADARDAAIAAAMTEFRSSAAAAPPAPVATPATVVSYRPRPAYSRYLAIAAAVVGIGVLGVVVTNLPSDADDDASDAPAAAQAAEETADVAERIFAEDDGAEDEAMIAAEAGSAAIAEDADATDDVAAEPTVEIAEPQEAPAGEEPPASPATGGDDGGSNDPADLALLLVGRTADSPITTPDELGAFGAALLALIEAEELPSTPETSCEPVVLDVAYLMLDEVVTEVFVGVDPQRALVIAIDTETCDIVQEAPLPG